MWTDWLLIHRCVVDICLSMWNIHKLICQLLSKWFPFWFFFLPTCIHWSFVLFAFVVVVFNWSTAQEEKQQQGCKKSDRLHLYIWPQARAQSNPFRNKDNLIHLLSVGRAGCLGAGEAVILFVNLGHSCHTACVCLVSQGHDAAVKKKKKKKIWVGHPDLKWHERSCHVKKMTSIEMNSSPSLCNKKQKQKSWRSRNWFVTLSLKI